MPPSNPSLAKGVSGLLNEGAVGLAKKAEKLLESGDDVSSILFYFIYIYFYFYFYFYFIFIFILHTPPQEHLRIARYFAEWAALAVEHETNPTKQQQQKEFVNQVRAKVYEMSVEKESSLMAKGVFTSAKLESEGRLSGNQGKELLKAHL